MVLSKIARALLLSTAFAAVLPQQDSLAQAPINLGTAVNHEGATTDDYAPFIIIRDGQENLYFTTSRPVAGKKQTDKPAEIFVSRRPLQGMGAKAHLGWSQAERVDGADVLSRYARGTVAVSSGIMILAGERDLAAAAGQKDKTGSSYQFDLYWVQKDGDGNEQVIAIDAVNHPEYWDSQPTLSPDGNYLVFVSNRPTTLSDKTTDLNLWLSRRDVSGSWTPPVLLDVLNTEGDEGSPHWGADGVLYFASNWDRVDGRPSSSGYDIFRAEITKNTAGFQFSSPQNIDDYISSRRCGAANAARINSSADDMFPFITADKENIFFASRRDGGFGEFDIYTAEMPKPCVRLVIQCLEQQVDTAGRVTSPFAPSREMSVTVSGVDGTFSHGDTLWLTPRLEYQLEVQAPAAEACVNRSVEPARFVVNAPWQDTVLVRTFRATSMPLVEKPIVFSDALGTPYFVTGYWWPNTSENYKEFKRKREANILDTAKVTFVDPNDYDYQSVTSVVDAFFENNIYREIDKRLDSLRRCYDTLSVRITVHGYTDNCALRPGQYLGDGDVEVGGIMIPEGYAMRSGSARTASGRQVSLPQQGQKGNIPLSKLRAHFTCQTIDKAMSARAKGEVWNSLKDKGLISFDADGFGVFNEANPCADITKDAQSDALPNQPIVAEECNKPWSRRVYIYVDILTQDQVRAGFKRTPCGELDKGYLARLGRIERDNALAAEEKARQVALAMEEQGKQQRTAEAPMPTVVEDNTAIKAGDATDIIYGPYTSIAEVEVARQTLAVNGVEGLISSSKPSGRQEEHYLTLRFPSRRLAENFLQEYERKAMVLRTLLMPTMK